jgi:hypothetical protein
MSLPKPSSPIFRGGLSLPKPNGSAAYVEKYSDFVADVTAVIAFLSTSLLSFGIYP